MKNDFIEIDKDGLEIIRRMSRQVRVETAKFIDALPETKVCRFNYENVFFRRVPRICRCCGAVV